jgi:hypothetical protein
MAAKDENTWLLFGGREFRDFEVELEFRTPVPTNGGLQFRSHWLPRPLKGDEKAADVPKQMYGYQANVETRQRNGSGRLVDENGRGPLAEPSPESVKTLKQYEWNKMRVSARGAVIEVFLHDVSALRLEDEAYIAGSSRSSPSPTRRRRTRRWWNTATSASRTTGARGMAGLFDGKSFRRLKEWGSREVGGARRRHPRGRARRRARLPGHGGDLQDFRGAASSRPWATATSASSTTRPSRRRTTATR